MSHASPVQTASIRVALGAVIIVGLIYALISAAVIAWATIDLTNQIDARLTGSLDRPQLQQNGGLPPGNDDEPDRPFGPQVFIWTIAADGSVTNDASTPDLPAAYQDVSAPQTVTISNQEVRIAGTPSVTGRIVVAQSLAPVQDTQHTIIVGTLAIAPFLLLTVFVGAVIIGRRVAAPVEAARRRQLDFTADASHELRTPLSVIEANTSLALSQERDSEWYKGAFGRVEQEALRMHHLLEDMLWLARFDAARMASSTDSVDLTTVVRQTVDRFSAVAQKRHLALSLDAPEEAVAVSASADMLDRLVAVLVDNACKYTPEGGRVYVAVTVGGGHPTLTVEDSGPGIADGDRERIFDRFHRSLETAAKTDGAGLGLAIADAVVKVTRGRWSIGSSTLGGARFSVRWSSGAA